MNHLASEKAIVIPSLYRGSVKDLLGPVQAILASGVAVRDALVFEYTDAFSVFDWGRMPDALPRKGEALAILAADFFEKLANPQTWKDFSKSPEALALRKANRFGACLNELGEELQSLGLRTHYLGVVHNLEDLPYVKSLQTACPIRRLVVQRVSAVPPTPATVFGTVVPDYSQSRQSSLPRLIPLEIVFRFGCTKQSSILERVHRDPGYLASIGYAGCSAEVGSSWDFPVLEVFTKLETTDRALSLSEALAITGLSGSQLYTVLLKTVWVAGLLKFWCTQAGLQLIDGKLEWALAADGSCFLADAIGLDELRLLKNGISLSKEALRLFYRKTDWYAAVERAKAQAKWIGELDWKKGVPMTPPHLSPQLKEKMSQLYLSLTQVLTGRDWFAEAWTLDRLLKALKEDA